MSLRRPLKRKEEVEDPKNLHNDSTFRSSDKRGLHLKAIAAVAYLKVMDAAGHSEVGFLFGKTKLAPKPDITVPRLELCAAVLAVEIAEAVSVDLNIASDDISCLFLKIARLYVATSSATLKGSTLMFITECNEFDVHSTKANGTISH